LSPECRFMPLFEHSHRFLGTSWPRLHAPPWPKSIRKARESASLSGMSRSSAVFFINGKNLRDRHPDPPLLFRGFRRRQQKRNVRKQITQARSLRAQTKHPPDCLRCRPRLASRQELARETVSRPCAPANTKGTRRESPQLVCLTTFFGSGPAATDPVTCVILALFRRGRQKLSGTESGSSSGRQLFALTFK